MKARAIVMILAIVAVSAVFFSCDKEDFKPVSEKVELDEATPYLIIRPKGPSSKMKMTNPIRIATRSRKLFRPKQR